MPQAVDYIDKLIPDAYHGTSRTNAQRILQDREFIPSGGVDFYLGDGVYFFEGARTLAEWWARKRFPEEEIGIILARIQLGICLDLTVPEYRELVKNVQHQLEQKEEQKVTDSMVLNFLATVVEPEIETVRCVFRRGNLEKVFSGSRIYDSLHIVICVKKTVNILEFELIDGGS